MSAANHIDFFSVTIPNKAGEGAKLLAVLRDAGINLRGVWAYPVKGHKSQVDLTPEDPKAFSKAARKLKLDVSGKKAAFFLSGEDKLGALAEVFAKLAAAGINVHATQAVCAGEGRYGAFIQVDEGDLKKAKKALA